MVESQTLPKVVLPHQVIHTLAPQMAPSPTNLPIMQRVMQTMEQFSEKQRSYHKYQDRVNYLRQQRSIEKERIQAQEQALQAKEQALQAQELMLKERAEKEQERQKNVQLRQILMNLGIDPDAPPHNNNA